MDVPHPLRSWTTATHLTFGLAAIAATTWACFTLDSGLGTAGFLQLIALTLLSLRGTWIGAAILAVVAFLDLNYFFVEPIFEIRFQGLPGVAIAELSAFLITSLLVTGLVKRSQRLAQVALASERGAEAAKNRLAEAVDAIPALVWSQQSHGSADFLNRRFREYTGLSPEGGDWDWMEMFHPDDRDPEAWRAALAAETYFERDARLRRADGSYRRFVLRATPVRDEAGRTVRWYGTGTEVEERYLAEQRAREHARILDLIHDTVFVRDAKDVITYWNRGAEDLYGWSADEAIGRVTHQLLHTLFPKPLPEIQAEFERTGRWEGELVHTTRDGARVVVASRWSLERDLQGRPVRILETNNDVTSRKRAEEALRQSQAQLEHVARVTTLGEVTASLAHEVNQPLGAIANNANACLGTLASGRDVVAEVREILGDIVADAERASSIVNRVRGIAQRSGSERAPLRIEQIVNDVVALVGSEATARRVRIVEEIGPDLPLVSGDRVQLQQVLLNLIVNGMEAMAGVEEGERVLSLRAFAEGEGDARSAHIAVRDQGTGLLPDETEKIFATFYTTKPSGMGLGLAISRSIVVSHGGRLWAEAGPGPGATFRLRIPAVAGPG